jgi:hypothetical protein
MKKNNLLIFVNNINSALLISSKLLEKKNKTKDVSIIIEERYSDGKIKFKFTNQYSKLIKKIFSSMGYKKVYFYRRPNNYEMFSLQNLLYIFKIKKRNKRYKEEIDNFIKLKKIDLNSLNEVWFSNDLISKIFLNNVDCSKSYFFHGLGDIMLLQKKSLLLKMIDKFKFIVNNYFYKIYFLHNLKSVKFYSFHRKNYNNKIFNLPNKINKDFYKIVLTRISKKFKKLIFKKKIVLITDNIILQKHDFYKAKKFSSIYVQHLINFFKKNKIEHSDYIFLFKWKGSVPEFHKKIFINEFKNKKLIIKDVNKYLKNYIPLEFLIPNLKPNFVTSYYSTINFFLKDIFPKIKIINTFKIHKSVEKDYLKYHRENNLVKLLENSEKIKKLVNVPYDMNV